MSFLARLAAARLSLIFVVLGFVFVLRVGLVVLGLLVSFEYVILRLLVFGFLLILVRTRTPRLRERGILWIGIHVLVAEFVVEDLGPQTILVAIVLPLDGEIPAPVRGAVDVRDLLGNDVHELVDPVIFVIYVSRSGVAMAHGEYP